MKQHVLPTCFLIVCTVAYPGCSSGLAPEDLDVQFGGVVTWRDNDNTAYEVDLSSCKIKTIQTGVGDPADPGYFISTANCEQFAVIATYLPISDTLKNNDREKVPKAFFEFTDKYREEYLGGRNQIEFLPPSKVEGSSYSLPWKVKLSTRMFDLKAKPVITIFEGDITFQVSWK